MFSPKGPEYLAGVILALLGEALLGERCRCRGDGAGNLEIVKEPEGSQPLSNS
jgi:hypothetical protein